MDNKQELYIALGAILKELKTELNNDLSNYAKINTEANKDITDNLTLLLDEIESVNEKIGNTNQVIIDISVDSAKKIEALENDVNTKCEETFVTDRIDMAKEHLVILINKLNKIQDGLNNELSNTVEGINKSLDSLDNTVKKLETDINSKCEEKFVTEKIGETREHFVTLINKSDERQSYLNSELSEVSKGINEDLDILDKTVKKLNEKENPDFDYVDNATDNERKLTLEACSILADGIHKSDSASKTIQKNVDNLTNLYEENKSKIAELDDDINGVSNETSEEIEILSKSILDNKIDSEKEIEKIKIGADESLSDLTKGVVESRITKDVLAQTKELVQDRGELSDAKIIGKANEFIVSLASTMRGEKGEQGDVKACINWEEGQTTECLTVVMYHGGAWQCIVETDSKPSSKSKDWNLIVNGIKEVYTTLSGDNVKLEMVTVDSSGEEKIHDLDYPLPKFLDTYDPEKNYDFYDSVMWKGHRWISRSLNPKGDPAESDDWGLFSMQGKRGAKGLKGDKGDMPSIESVVKALKEDELKNDNQPIKRWSGLWKYNKPNFIGDLLSFDSGIWLTIGDDDGSIPPSDINNKNFVLLLRNG